IMTDTKPVNYYVTKSQCSNHFHQPKLVKYTQGRNLGETVDAKALNPHPFMILGYQQRLVALGMNRTAQIRQLLAMIKIAGEENDPANQRVAQAGAFMAGQHRAFYIDHHRSRRQAYSRVL